MDNKFILGSVVVVAIIAIIGVFNPTSSQVVKEITRNVGSVVGPDVYQQMRLHDGVVIGGGKLATTTAASSIFTADALCNNSVIVLTPAASGNKTVSVASSSAMFSTCLPDPGDSITLLVDHATTTGTNAITWADTGANTDHLEDEGATTVMDVSESARLTFTNLDDTTMLFEVKILQAAD